MQRDHCRIGSLEMSTPVRAMPREDHCRIGSLEKLYKEYKPRH